MEQDNVAVAGVPEQVGQDPGAAARLPVLRVHGPEDHGKVHLFADFQQRVVVKPAGRPEQGSADPGVFAQQLGAGFQVRLNFLPGHAVHELVAAAVQSHLVAALHNPGQGVRVLLHPVAADKEGGPDLPLGQALQQPVRHRAGGTVVKRQGNPAF